MPAPAVRTERDVFFLVPVQSLEIGEEGGDGGHHVVVEGGGADGDVFRGHRVRDDVRIVAEMQIVQAGFQTAGEERAFDRVRHRLGGVPHGVVNDRRRIVVFVVHPRFVEGEDVGDVLRPDDAVAGADGVDLQAFERGERLARLHSVRLYDVRVVLARLDVRLGQVAFCIQPLVGGVVLTEGVVGKEDVAGRHEGHHVVRPVYHGGGHESEGALAEGERFARLHADVAQVAVVGGQIFYARARRAVHLCIFGALKHRGDAAAVVGFGVVGDDDVDLRGVDYGGDAREHLRFEAALHRVDEGDFFVEDKIGVVGGAFLRFVAVEIPEIPVDGAHPVDAFGDLHCLHSSAPI